MEYSELLDALNNLNPESVTISYAEALLRVIAVEGERSEGNIIAKAFITVSENLQSENEKLSSMYALGRIFTIFSDNQDAVIRTVIATTKDTELKEELENHLGKEDSCDCPRCVARREEAKAAMKEVEDMSEDEINNLIEQKRKENDTE